MSTTEPSVLQRATDGARVLFGVGGLIAIALGLFVLFAPGASASIALTVTAVLLALYAIITGLVYLGTSVFSKTLGGWARIGHILLGLLYLIGGVIMMSNLLMTGVVVAIFIAITIGVLWLLEGVMAFATVRESPNKTWNVIYGIISVLAGITLMFSPMMSAAVLWMLLGASMLVLGVIQVVRAFTIKSEA